MARINNAAITGDDAKYMVDFEGWIAKNYSALTGLQCLNKLDIEFYMEAYVPDTYADNQLPTYNNFFKAMVTDPLTSVFVPKESGTTGVVIYPTDSGAWTSSESIPWFYLSPTSGTGATSIIITYSANTLGVARSGTIVFTDTNTGQSRNFLVQQEAGVIVATTPVSVSGGGVTFEDACSRYPGFATTLYIPDGETWAADGNGPSQLYNNSNGTYLAPAGYYADGNVSRYWNGSGFSGFQNC